MTKQKIPTWGIILLIVGAVFLVSNSNLGWFSVISGTKVVYVDENICGSNLLTVNEPPTYADYLTIYCGGELTIGGPEDPLFDPLNKTIEYLDLNVLLNDPNYADVDIWVSEASEDYFQDSLCVSIARLSLSGDSYLSTTIFNYEQEKVGLLFGYSFFNEELSAPIDCRYLVLEEVTKGNIINSSKIKHTIGYELTNRVPYPLKEGDYVFCSEDVFVGMDDKYYYQYLTKFTECVGGLQCWMLEGDKCVEHNDFETCMLELPCPPLCSTLESCQSQLDLYCETDGDCSEFTNCFGDAICVDGHCDIMTGMVAPPCEGAVWIDLPGCKWDMGNCEECIFVIGEYCIKLWMLLVAIGGLLFMFMMSKK